METKTKVARITCQPSSLLIYMATDIESHVTKPDQLVEAAPEAEFWHNYWITRQEHNNINSASQCYFHCPYKLKTAKAQEEEEWAIFGEVLTNQADKMPMTVCKSHAYATCVAGLVQRLAMMWTIQERATAKWERTRKNVKCPMDLVGS